MISGGPVEGRGHCPPHATHSPTYFPAASRPSLVGDRPRTPPRLETVGVVKHPRLRVEWITEIPRDDGYRNNGYRHRLWIGFRLHRHLRRPLQQWLRDHGLAGVPAFSSI